MKKMKLHCKKTVTLNEEDIEQYKHAEELAGSLSDIDVFRVGLQTIIKSSENK